MNQNKIITYSLLAYIRNNTDEQSIKSSLDIFIPLIKRVLSKLNNDNIHKGKNISEIKERADQEYGLNFPLPVLEKILREIAKEVNTEDKTRFEIYNDKSFAILEYTFDDYEKTITEREEKIKSIEKLFTKFKEAQTDNVIDSKSIFEFVERNKYNLSKYLSDKKEFDNKDYTLEARFINHFKKTEVYEIIKDIYLGSILSCYIEYKPNIKVNSKKVELLFDTNFIVSLLDLNTKESTHTCKTLVEVAGKSAYSFSVLEETIQETKNLLMKKAEDFDKSFLSKRINPEDVFNACERRGLKRSDLENIADNIESELEKYNINIIKSGLNKSSIQDTAEYKKLKNIRESKIGAIHDAIATIYVKRKRENKKIKNFEDVNIWFVNNSFSHSSYLLENEKGYQPEVIRVDNLLNILWLSNPSIANNDLSNIGLSSSISLTLSQNLPKAKVLKQLDENIYKYAKDNISDENIIRISNRITVHELEEIEELNALAEKKDKQEFINRLNEVADKQKETEERTNQNIKDALNSLALEVKSIKEERKMYANKSINDTSIIDSLNKELDKKDSELLNKDDEIKKLKNEKIERYKTDKLRNRQIISFVLLLGYIFVLIAYYIYNQKSFEEAFNEIKKDWFLHSFIFTLLFTYWFLMNFNESNKKSFKDNIKIPEKFK